MEWRSRKPNGFDPKKGQKVCFNLTKPGGCRFGNSCKFAHPVEQAVGRSYLNGNGTQSTTGRNGKVDQNSQDTKRDAMIRWRRAIPLNPLQAQPLGRQLGMFFQTALDLIDTDHGVMQDIILSLNSEGGFLRLRELLEQDFELMADATGAQVVSSQLVPFFKIITNVNVATSIMLEDKLHSIFNYLYGRQGERGAKVFTFVVKTLGPTKQSDLRSNANLEPIFATFSSMINLNSNSIVNETLPVIAKQLLEICDCSEEDTKVQLRRLTKSIERRLGLRHSVKEDENSSKPVRAKASFVLSQELPGTLSTNGPRHDNDHADIQDIMVLPTFNEIKATRAPYLPPRDTSQHHVSGVRGLLDRHFRLLREDTIGQLWDAVCGELEQIKPSRQNAARVNTYHNLIIMGLSFSRWKGLRLAVQIEQPHHLQKLSTKERRDWWEHTNRLQVDALVCIIDNQDTITFCTVSELSHASGAKDEESQHDLGKDRTMYGDAGSCFLQLQLVDPDNTTLTNILRQLDMPGGIRRLVEFPGVLLPSFKPTLEALKTMSKRNDLPFSNFLAPEAATDNNFDEMTPPTYAVRPGFSFELQDTIKDKSSMKYDTRHPFDLEKFKAQTILDEAQADALVSCLGRSFALIQGPPGTGKSFTGVALIKVLLAAKKQAKLGPILCVCYTNHALDQLLEHLVHHGVKQIIRIGSRSKSEILEQCNLRVIAQNMEMTGPEKKQRWNITEQLLQEEREIQDLLQMLLDHKKESTVKHYLLVHFPAHYDQLFAEEDEDGFMTVHHDRYDRVQAWLRTPSIVNVKEHTDRPLRYLKTAQINTMTSTERRALYHFWLREIKSNLQEQIGTALALHAGQKAGLDKIRHEQQLRCLQQANVIGVTTTGLARQLDLLRNLSSKVLICEEAGEVLEAHILTALLPSLEHTILIGDHQQLPPHIQNYDLSRENPRGEQYSLDLSLFERLVNPVDAEQALPYQTLETQRRMHPSISKLIRMTLYPQLKDSLHVENYPTVAGMKKRLFWFDHREPEAGSDPSRLATTSHSNDFEIGMVVALVTHLVRQGVYAANDIAVLTPYLGQLHKIRKVLRNQFEITMNERDVQEMQRQGLEDDSHGEEPRSTGATKTALLKALAVSTIDNFQGEEAKVVIMSLVRSNPENKCGFLKTPNRINVLLSRAKHGMYIMGNAQTSGHVKMWSDVISMLQSDGNFGEHFELECPRHPDTPILVSKPDDFIILSPEGGCDKKCDKRLDCGHRDQSKCHSDAMHKAVMCLEPCPRQLKGCEHGCTKLCGENCIAKCQVVLNNINVRLECGHVKTSLPCWQFQDPFIIRCRTIVSRTVPGCEHEVSIECWTNINSELFRCRAACGATLDCGHTCQRPCFQCTNRQDDRNITINHGTCVQVCGRKFANCSHYCQMKCHGDAPCECNAPCDNACEHSKCPKKCNEPCVPCASTTCTTGRCPHREASCSMPCAAPCDWLPCAERCENILVCGHRCPTVCGEVCPPPQLCQICASQDVKDTVVDYILMSTYGDVDLDEDPCVIPKCGHILTISSMDGQMEMSKHYKMQDNNITGIKEHSMPFSMDELKVCGTCRGSLRSISRYGRIVRRALLDESTKKFIRWAGLKTIRLTQAFYDEQERLGDSLKIARKDVKETNSKVKLSDSASDQIRVIVKEQPGRYKQIDRIRKDISRHVARVKIDEQPFKKVWDLVQHAKRLRDGVGQIHFDTTVLQTRETVQSTSLLIRCDFFILSDFCALTNKKEIHIDLTENRASCTSLIELSKQAKQPLHTVEGHLYFAQLCAAERALVGIETGAGLMDQARNHVVKAREICQESPGSTRRITSEVDEVEKMVLSSTFYTQVRDNEWKEVMSAMSREFRGTGHWYNCVNGHPFTIGECGAPMERARCPQCGAPIGGQDHESVEGVVRADDLERQFGQMTL